MGRLDAVDLSKRLSKAESEERIAALQRRLLHLRLVCGGLVDGGRFGPPLCIVFEGWDAAGKGGSIKRLVSRLDPRHVRVGEYAAPSNDERRHHFLLRFAGNVPGWGGMAVFDRSWYGRVLVERVEGFATEAEWRRAYDEIVAFERSLVEEGVSLVKFWLHISAEEQERRFLSRQADPLRRWKLTDEDWRNREKRPAYEVAVEEMFERTDHRQARWDIIAAENKPYARVKVLRTVVERMEDGMRRWGIEPPPSTGADFDVSR
ncbi:MAG TPA: UDP-galactose-lipid carrier transferase [Acidimicrobiales bacterium]|nr:UDP-galactose-lipid carrier transferase [Acidimicrobiales bacterium]